MKHILMFLLTACVAQTAAAEALTYHCKVKGRDGWIAPEYQFRIDPESGTAQVVNGYHDWMATNLSIRKNDTHRMSWSATIPSSEGQAILMRYQANLDHTKNKVKVRGSFGNVAASNKPYGTGNCVLIK